MGDSARARSTATTAVRSTSDSDFIRVVVDDREATSKVVEALRLDSGCKVEVRRLSIGDYQVAGRLVFERKTLRDLVVSIIDGRLLSQARRMANGPLRPVILLEGSSRDLVQSGMRREAIQGALIAASVLMGIPLLRARNAEESALLILLTARQTSESIRGGLARGGARPKSKRAVQLHILQGLPHVGPTRAARLLDRFGTVQGAITATPENLAEIEGLGPTLVRKIRWAVNEQAASYAVVRPAPTSHGLDRARA